MIAGTVKSYDPVRVVVMRGAEGMGGVREE